MFLLIKNIFSGIILWINNNKRKFFGGLIGLIVSILILTIGFFRTLFIFLCVTVGCILGSLSLTKHDIKGLLENINPSNWKD